MSGMYPCDDLVKPSFKHETKLKLTDEFEQTFCMSQ